MPLDVPFALRSPLAGGRAIARAPQVPVAPPPRLALYELPSHLLCSIVGTCLGTAELRKLVARALGRDLRDHGDVEVHTEGVSLAGERGAASKAIHKALDARHAGWLKRLGRHADVDALNAAWDEAVESGDIPGAYWAVLSHPATDAALTRRAFGDVHMLSHLVGASNRADLRRLKRLERDHDALADRLERQQARLRHTQAERDALARELRALLLERAPTGSTDEAHDASVPAELATLRRLVDDQRARLDHAKRRRDDADRQAARLRERVVELQARVDGSEAERRTQAAETAALEALVGETLAARADDAPTREADALPLRDQVVLVVGGHVHTVDAMRRIAVARGARFLHHDGGVEERTGQLAGLVSRCTIALFPVDCVSHEAALAVKRLCRRFDRPFTALRSMGLSSFAAALDRLACDVPPTVSTSRAPPAAGCCRHDGVSAPDPSRPASA